MSNKKNNTVLIGLFADLLKGEGQLKKLATQLDQVCVIKAISSIYKRESKISKTYPQLWTVILAETEFSESELNARLQSGIILLAYNQEVKMTPGATIPSPRLFDDMVILRCASEVWGSYEHPVLGQTLNELVKSVRSKEEIEYYAQGAKLLDMEKE